jgi:hypothetical protein
MLLLPSIDLFAMSFENDLVERFCEDIGDLIFSFDGVYRQKTRLNVLTKMMILNVQMFRARANFRYFSHFNGSRVVFKDFAVYSCIIDVDWDALGFGFSQEVNKMNNLPHCG